MHLLYKYFYKYIPNKENKSNYDSFKAFPVKHDTEKEEYDVYKPRYKKGNAYNPMYKKDNAYNGNAYKTKRHQNKRIRRTRKNNVVRRIIEKIF